MPSMQPRVHLVTLGVSDLARSVRFYRDGLGWPHKGGDDAVAFFQLGPMVLAVWLRDELARDAHKEPGPPSPAPDFALAQNQPSVEAVNGVMAAAEAAGATIVKPAHDTFWGGYSGYFADPDGHLWEIAWNPFWTITADGGIELPG